MGLRTKYLKRVFYTFCPKFLFNLSLFKRKDRNHWQKQNVGDSHGYDKYDFPQEERDRILVEETALRVEKDEPVLDLGCNCGRDISLHKEAGFTCLTGIDICKNAIEYGKDKFKLGKTAGVDFIVGSYEEVLPRLVSEGKRFSLIYSGGASVSLVHPSFDIIKYLCKLSDRYIVLLNEDNQDNAYSRFWECEFRRNGFVLVKYLSPAYPDKKGTGISSSIAVYEKMKG